jgi:meso-butanediol dehydrogenase / (S,S)-butanediol dehydrogenase / diacetyl reductase
VGGPARRADRSRTCRCNSTMKPPEKRVAFVTGAASGIGLATVRRFVEKGTAVVALDNKIGDELRALEGEGYVLAFEGDVRDAALNVDAVGAGVQRFGSLGVAVLNAGITHSGSVEDATIEQLDEVLSINVKGVVLGFRACIPALRTHGAGAVVITASVSGLAGDPSLWAYNGSKAAVINMMRAWALDYAASNIRVNAVCPGPIKTRLTEPLYDGPGTPVGDQIIANIPMQRWGDADEVASAIEFLTSASASYITGVALPVDGGVTASTGQFSSGRSVD